MSIISSPSNNKYSDGKNTSIKFDISPTVMYESSNNIEDNKDLLQSVSPASYPSERSISSHIHPSISYINSLVWIGNSEQEESQAKNSSVSFENPEEKEYLQSHYFFKDITNDLSPEKERNIFSELECLSDSLKMTNGIFVVASHSHPQLLSALIFGPPEQTAEEGVCLIDIFLPSDYPSHPAVFVDAADIAYEEKCKYAKTTKSMDDTRSDLEDGHSRTKSGVEKDKSCLMKGNNCELNKIVDESSAEDELFVQPHMNLSVKLTKLTSFKYIHPSKLLCLLLKIQSCLAFETSTDLNYKDNANFLESRVVLPINLFNFSLPSFEGKFLTSTSTPFIQNLYKLSHYKYSHHQFSIRIGAIKISFFRKLIIQHFF